MSNSRPALKLLVPSCSINGVLQALAQKPYEPLHLCPLELLTRKVLFLVAAASARRRSCLQALSVRPGHVRFENHGVRLIPDHQFLARNQTLTFLPGDIFIPEISSASSVPEDRKWCPVRALKWYLHRTKEVRASDRLFVLPRRPFTAASKDTISRWLTEVITPHAGGKVRAHQVRGMAASKALFAGVPIEDILKAAAWKTPSTFVACYLSDTLAAETAFGVPESPLNLREIERLTSSNTLAFSWTPGEDGGETQYFDITFCPVGRSSKCEDRQQTLPNYTATNLLPYTKYKITLYSHNAVGYSNGYLSREGITLPLSPAKEGIDITYNSDTGEVFTTKNPSGSLNMEEGPCLRLEVRSSTPSSWEEQTLPCLMKGVKVTIPKDLPLSYIRVKSCIPETQKCSSVEAIALAVVNDEPPTKLIIIIAVIAVFIVLVVFLILFVLCRRKPSHSNVHSGEPFEMKKRTDGYKSFSKDYDNNTGKGEKEAFLPPAPKQPNGHGVPVDNNPSPTNHSNGLIYEEIVHSTNHPPNQPPIRTEPETEYADLDFKKMEEIQEENRKNEENTKTMNAMTQIVPPPGYPESGLECV
ncbi:hypothetical protein HOLleu_21019 [Holothuria leucospilota]|uniref:Fibronectin type-III domain-containing protein n=1 Tax=Holothuria leucospilota TaxID=206669 RepID=A0A9Q1H667_HOLLE|nr:hypothetical protein HOLleu_21019 [Holothuria leucospilota]